ncbi:hypothetical protein [Bradyrhizobium embrapense]
MGYMMDGQVPADRGVFRYQIPGHLELQIFAAQRDGWAAGGVVAPLGQ